MAGNSGNSFEVGTVLNNKWVILEFIAKGGMGEVYRVHQLNLKRDVAIKVVSQELLEDLDEDEEEIETTLQRFRREVEAMARIRHPNVLQIFDHDSIPFKEDQGNAAVEYLVMEYIPGSTLRSTMSEEGFYPEEDLSRSWVADYFLPVLEGVGAMHELDIVHRDLKPENVLMDGNTPKIADFGLAASRRWKPVTQSIHVMGTAAYMAPEQFMDFKGADHKADIYALGKILFESINGKITSNTIPMKSAALANPETPFFTKMDRIIQEATAEDKNDRFQSVTQFRNALLEGIATEAWKPEKTQKYVLPSARSDVSTPARPKWFWPGIAVAGISAGLIGLWLWHVLDEPGKLAPNLKAPQVIHEYAPPEPSVDSGQDPRPIAPLKQILETEDGVTLHLISGGSIPLPESFSSKPGKTVDVDPFYMDETQVTNHQYIEFLNQVLPEIRVEKNVVQGGNEIWFLMGEVMKGYEPIVFQEGKFHIKKPAHASCPVVRVTGYGASAYARFYGRRLPFTGEWFYAVKEGRVPREETSERASGVETAGGRDKMMRNMKNGRLSNREQTAVLKLRQSLPIHAPVILFEQNIFGIRGLNGSISEWVFSSPTPTGIDNETEYIILGQFASHAAKGKTDLSAILRQPWEAFEEVGFRCVISAKAFEKE